MDTVALASCRWSFRVGKRVGNLQCAAHMADLVVSDRHICYSAVRALVPLVFGGYKNRKTRLAEPAPSIFQDVAFEKNPLCILQFKMIFHDKRSPGSPSHKAQLSLLPDHTLEEMITADRNIPRQGRAGVNAQEADYIRRFQ